MSFFISALYKLRYVLIVNVILVIFIQKKKKQQKTKNDPYFGMGKNIKVMPQNAPLSIFSLGKGREYYVSNPMNSYQSKCTF